MISILHCLTIPVYLQQGISGYSSKCGRGSEVAQLHISVCQDASQSARVRHISSGPTGVALGTINIIYPEIICAVEKNLGFIHSHVLNFIYSRMIQCWS